MLRMFGPEEGSYICLPSILFYDFLQVILIVAFNYYLNNLML